MKNVLLLGALYSQDCIEEYKQKSSSNLQYAAQNLQESIIEGLIENNVSVEVLTKPILSTWPKGYNDVYINTCAFVFHGETMGYSMGFFNLPLLNYPPISKYLNHIDNWYSTHNGPKSIMVYSLSRHLMKVAIEAKKKHNDIELIQIVPDLPRFMGCNKYYKMLGQQKRDIRAIYDLVNHFDKYVLLCENMAKDLGVERKPHVVVEGIFSSVGAINDIEKDPHKVILYTGNLDLRYGIRELLDAFSLIKDSDYRLWLRGNGNSEPLVRERMRSDSRIQLIPAMTKTELIKLQKRATLLVNPVKPSQDFTKYFFPSKTMDYLASGTPTLMFKLDCLPNEYYSYLLFFQGESSCQMAETIMEVCSKDPTELAEIGLKAKLFIENNKLSKNQVHKIINM